MIYNLKLIAYNLQNAKIRLKYRFRFKIIQCFAFLIKKNTYLCSSKNKYY